LGIVIGITSVVAMVSLVGGLNRSLVNQLASLGSDTISVDRFDTLVQMGNLPDSLRNRPHFDEEDAIGIRQSAPAVAAVTIRKDSRERLRYRGEESRRTSIRGIDAYHLFVRGFAISEGRDFTELEYRSGARGAIIGSEIAEELFAGFDPIGEVLTIRNQRFEVIGILEERGNFLGQSLDNQVLIPLATLERYFVGPRAPIQIDIKPMSPDLVPAAREQITESLRRTRELRPQDPNNFALNTQENLLNLYRQITGAFFMVVVAIASVALLVGGIGVMNIMLVSVTERTREIGIRKALGAQKRQILSQFLVEATVLTAAGGIIGILFGVLIGILIDRLTPLPAYVPLWAYVAAVSVSAGVGLFFGIWPAVRAAKLHPVDALRYE
ncbi:MAG: ABC transporter permease, partial [Candidatus Eisenbacteria bacterium]|nr:ABC transporter permease [Candidatus Eisenbacteria bacterium]